VDFGNALDQTVETQSREVITHAALGERLHRLAQQLGQIEARSWLLEKPAGNRSNISTACHKAWTVGIGRAVERTPVAPPQRGPLKLLQSFFG